MNARIAPATDITEKPNSKRCHTMATAVSGSVIGATPCEVRGFAKIKPVVGQSPLPVIVASERQLVRHDLGGAGMTNAKRETSCVPVPTGRRTLFIVLQCLFFDGREPIQNLGMKSAVRTLV
jgi:hypothetical protein